MKKYGFTMIELVFVIVILGILAGVAIPRLSATRDDAEFTKALTDLEILVKDIQNMYYSQGAENMPTLGRTNIGDIYLDLKGLTNVKLDYSNAQEPVYYVGNKPCYRLDVVRMDRGGEFSRLVNRDVIVLLLKPQDFEGGIKPACQRLRQTQLFKQYDWSHPIIFNFGGIGRYDAFAGGVISGSQGLFKTDKKGDLEEIAKHFPQYAKQIKDGTATIVE